jgi:hypothetical protein
MVRTRTDGELCNVDPWTCTGSVTRFVWAGDNLLWELKQADGSMAGAAGGMRGNGCIQRTWNYQRLTT